MQCYCCEAPIKLAKKVKIRRVRELSPEAIADPAKAVASGAYTAYREEMTYRWAVICLACYRILDNEVGMGEVPGRGIFGLAGASRVDKARVMNEAQYRAFQRKEAAKLGIDLE